tara:strand:+ start:240 stop:1475 length:1236 start_codon:yes stop_codon:yes gene_type:complete
MAVEDYDTGVTRKTHAEVTAADRAQSRLRVDPTGTRWDDQAGWWNETFSPEYARNRTGEGYYSTDPATGKRINPSDFGADDIWTDTRGAFGDTGWATPFGLPVGDPEKKSPRKGGQSDEYKKYLEWMKSQGIAGAKSVMKGFLNQFGLGDLSKWAMAQAEKGLTGDAIVIEMRYGTDANVRAVYDKKFPAMAERRKRGFMEITEQEYLQLGRGYSQIAGAAGISADFLSGDGITVAEDGVTSLIAGDVSLAEWRGRVQTAEEAVFKASDQVKALLETRYGFSSGDLVSAFLDPSKTKNIVDARRQLGAATLAGAAQNVIGSPISEGGSEWMFNQDIQAREVVQALSPLRGLTEGTLTSDAMSADDLAGGKFGGGFARKKFQRNLQGRVSDFDTSSGIALGQQGVYGLGTAK